MEKSLCVFALAMVLLSSCGVFFNVPYKPVPSGLLPLAGHEREVIHLVGDEPTDSVVRLYAANEQSLDSLVRLSDKRYAVFYLGNHYTDKNFFYRLAEYMGLHEEYFDFFPLFSTGYGAGYTHEMLRWEQYYRPVFVPDSAMYGGKTKLFHPLDEQLPFVMRICPECDTDSMWLHGIVVLEHGRLLKQTNYRMDKFEVMEMIERLPLND